MKRKYAIACGLILAAVSLASLLYFFVPRRQAADAYTLLARESPSSTTTALLAKDRQSIALHDLTNDDSQFYSALTVYQLSNNALSKRLLRVSYQDQYSDMAYAAVIDGFAYERKKNNRYQLVVYHLRSQQYQVLYIAREPFQLFASADGSMLALIESMSPDSHAMHLVTIDCRRNAVVEDVRFALHTEDPKVLAGYVDVNIRGIDDQGQGLYVYLRTNDGNLLAWCDTRGRVTPFSSNIDLAGSYNHSSRLYEGIMLPDGSSCTISSLSDGRYELSRYRGDRKIASLTFNIMKKMRETDYDAINFIAPSPDGKGVVFQHIRKGKIRSFLHTELTSYPCYYIHDASKVTYLADLPIITGRLDWYDGKTIACVYETGTIFAHGDRDGTTENMIALLRVP